MPAVGEKKLDGKVAVVTGAGSSGPGFGTGKAISVQLAREGAKVVLVDMFEERAKETLDIITEEGGEGAVVVADLSQISECRRVIAESVAIYGGVDILVNNAAMGNNKGLLDIEDEVYEKMIAINLTAPFMLCQAAIPVMIERGGGSIVNISSIASMRGQGGGKGQAAYASAKAGLRGLMVDVADSFGKQGIRINCVAPGIIKTPMRDQSMIQAGLDPDEFDLTFKVSLPYEGDAWDIARAVSFLAGPDGRFITGHFMPVDGGTTARSH
jgi:NAD(P)-dependent dehydrogenase (short-subunit alcohol dehydrogenase family)